MNFFSVIKLRLSTFINNSVYFQNFAYEVFRNFLNFYHIRKITSLVLFRQIFFTGFQALSLIGFSALMIGSIIMIEAHLVFANLGHDKLMYTILVSVVTRELGSFIPALIIIARSGTAMTTEIGNMVINAEIDALNSMGVSPLAYLVVPRQIAVVFSLLPLSVYFNIIALLCSGIMAQLLFNITFNDFFIKLFAEMNMGDILLNVIKAVLFGIAIPLISCYQGLNVIQARTEVPQRTSKAVVQSISAVIFLDIIIISVFYML